MVAASIYYFLLPPVYSGFLNNAAAINILICIHFMTGACGSIDG
jgi:hypothetical protein